MMIKRTLLFIGLITILSGCINIPIPLGDGNKLMVGTDGISFVDDEDTEFSIDIDEDGGTFSIDGLGEEGNEVSYSVGEDGNATVTFMDEDGTEHQSQMGENLELPFNLPEDVPLPNNANIYQYINAQGRMLVNLRTDDSLEQLKALYEPYFTGSFQSGPVTTDLGMAGFVEKYIAATNEYEIHVQLTGGDNDSPSNVTIDIYNIYEFYGEDYDFDYMYNYDYDEDY